jgi:hypothetical protein
VSTAGGDVLAALEVLHAIPGRLRIRAPGLRGQPESLNVLAELIAEMPGVRRVSNNPATGSVLILHEPERCAELAAQLVEQEALQKTAEPAIGQQLAERLGVTGRHVESLIGARFDLRGAAALLLLGVAIAQVARGNVLVPATTAAWYALELLSRASREQ